MSHKLPRILFPPIHLSTAILLTFLAGALMWANTTPFSGEFDTPYYVCVFPASMTRENMPDGSSKVRIIPAKYEERLRHESAAYGIGFPFTFSACSKPTFEGLRTFNLGPLIYNICFGLYILWSLARIIAIFWTVQNQLTSKESSETPTHGQTR